MQCQPSNFASSFIADSYKIRAIDQFTEQVAVRRLDEAFSEQSLDRLDFKKVDL